MLPIPVRARPRCGSRRLPHLLFSLLSALPLALATQVGLADPQPHLPALADSQLRSKALQAFGDPAAIRGLRNVTATGTMVGLDGFPGTYRMAETSSGKKRVTWDIRYLRQTTSYDGDQGWERTVAVRQLAGSELGRTRRDARFLPLHALLESNTAFTVSAGRCAGSPVYMLHFIVDATHHDDFGVDPATFRLRCEIRNENYTEGQLDTEFDYHDYRSVDGVLLPFRYEEERPDNSLKVRIATYQVNSAIPAGFFGNPNRAHFDSPIRMELSTSPAHVYKEPMGRYTSGSQRYWGMHFYPSESWSFDLVVKEAYGRYLEPQSARMDFYSGERLVSSQQLSRDALLTIRRHPVARFWPLGDIYGFRHNVIVPSTDEIDRMIYTYGAKGLDGRLYTARLTIPVTVYHPKAKLIFPIKGKFIVTSGHDFYELEHKYERSQQFSIDIVPLGNDFQLATHDGATVDDYVGYARRVVMAPADGRVVFARNDVPDGAVKAKFLKLKDGLQAIAGNLVIIDHGHGEYSLFAHMHHGSVRVKTGDLVKQGQPIGLVGASGSPGLPHLHYQLQNGPRVFGADGLPLIFQNIERIGWIGGSAANDEHGAAKVDTPAPGVFMEAK